MCFDMSRYGYDLGQIVDIKDREVMPSQYVSTHFRVSTYHPGRLDVWMRRDIRTQKSARGKKPRCNSPFLKGLECRLVTIPCWMNWAGSVSDGRRHASPPSRNDSTPPSDNPHRCQDCSGTVYCSNVRSGVVRGGSIRCRQVLAAVGSYQYPVPGDKTRPYDERM